MIIALTGHRPSKLGNEYNLQGPVSDALRRTLYDLLTQYEPEKCISGMALGADMIFAQVTLSLAIPLIAAIPCVGQESVWPDSSKKMYNEILDNPLTEKHIVCEGGYEMWKLQKRNEFMVNECNLLFAIWDGSAGGTSNCMKYAEKVGRNYHIINPKELLYAEKKKEN